MNTQLRGIWARPDLSGICLGCKRASVKAAQESTIKLIRGDDDGVRQTMGGRGQQDYVTGACCNAGASTRRRNGLALTSSRFERQDAGAHAHAHLIHGTFARRDQKSVHSADQVRWRVRRQARKISKNFLRRLRRRRPPPPGLREGSVFVVQ